MEGYHHWLRHSKGQANVCQITLLLIWITIICLWTFRRFFNRKTVQKTGDDIETGKIKYQRKKPNDQCLEQRSAEVESLIDNNKSTTSEGNIEKQFSKFKPPPTFDEFLFYCVVFGAFMMFFYLCYCKNVFPAGEREYSRDLFVFLCLILFGVGCYFTVQVNEDKILNRDQTEEWKGWMQVMFVWYHYYDAVEIYNIIRVFIACYVWMTGFGNFSFFWIRQDFSIWRICKMMFRLNFLVVFIAVVTNNQYMLYYICAMHTYWFITVYVFMRVLSSWNTQPKLMAVKFVAYFICNTVIFDLPYVADVVFTPFWPILSMNNSLYEWKYRAKLDHYAALVGMISAYNYPNYERLMKYLDQKHTDKRDRITLMGAKIMSLGVLGILLGVWYYLFMSMERDEYNQYHPYISWFPILSYIFVRNLFPFFRTHHIGLFTWLGKITLETYITQFHIYLAHGKRIIFILIDGYPLINVVFSTAVYLIVSFYLLRLTTEFSAFFLPKDMKKVLYHFIGITLIFCIHFCFAFLLRDIIGLL